MIAHLLNVEWYNNSRQGVYDELSTALSNLEDGNGTTYLNPIRITDLVGPRSLPLAHDRVPDPWVEFVPALSLATVI